MDAQAKNTLKKSKYVVRDVVISDKNINDFELLGADQARKKREPKIKAIKKKLLDGINFDAPIVVVKNGKMIVIDGMHRISAIRNAIDENSNFTIEVTLFQYENKTPDERGILFKNWNSGTPQSTDDYLQMFAADIPIWNMMKKPDFVQTVGACNMYPIVDEVHFRKWVGSYTAAILNSPSGNTLTNEKFLEVVKRLDRGNYEQFKEMVEDIKGNIPSILERGYRHATTTGIAVIVYAYHHLVTMGHMNRVDFWKQYHKHVASSDDYWAALGISGITATKFAMELFMRLINKGLHIDDMITVPGI